MDIYIGVLQRSETGYTGFQNCVSPWTKAWTVVQDMLRAQKCIDLSGQLALILWVDCTAVFVFHMVFTCLLEQRQSAVVSP